MQVVYGINDLPTFCPKPVVLALGNFDGVHLGHQKVIGAAVEQAHYLGRPSAALIFDPHPLRVISQEGNLLSLTDLELKAELLSKLGLDYMVVEPFTNKLAEISPEKFLNNYLKEIIKIEGVVAGYDYTFGYRASGDVNFLQQWGRKNNIKVTICDPVKVGNEPVSSSLIRDKILSGKVDEAANLLNYYFFRRGSVVPGRGKGKKIGFPTANLKINSQLILPQEGVYFTLVNKNQDMYPAATNVGRCPTFSLNYLTVEVNIIDFDGDLYDESITVFFIKKIRDEKMFSSTEELKKQLHLDVVKVKQLAQSNLKESYVLQR